MIGERLGKLMRRALKAHKLGLRFRGTSSFALPSSAHVAGRARKLSFPEDNALALDVIDLWLDDDYGLEKLRASPKSILDVGANVGLFSLWASHIFPSAQIHTYEPNPAVLPHLLANLSGLPRVKVWPEGVSDVAGRAQLDANVSSRLAQTQVSDNGEIVLTAIGTAVERLGNKVDLLKLDCEGAEWAIFRSPAPFRRVREIRMEYHLTEGRTLDDLRAAAALIRFRITHLRENAGFGIAFLENQEPLSS